MEIQFQKKAISYLQTLLREQQKQEQTQQIRVPDTMPDIERVLECWGQILIRGKEWRSGSVGVSGGIHAWVLYQPEGQAAPCCIDTWIPFQMKWDTESTERDGTMEVCTSLCHIDARMLSDRKLLVRADICIQMHARIGNDIMIYMPAEFPENLQTLQRTYPMMLPVEAGEKQFDVEQQLDIPSDGAPFNQIVRFAALPTLSEYKIVADKLVLRGNVEIYVLYLDDVNRLCSYTWKVPFSQYVQLDGEYPPEAEASVCFELTQLELEPVQADTLNLKLSFTAQYLISHIQNMTITEDMYCPMRGIKQSIEQLNLPSVLHSRSQEIKADFKSPEGNVVDVSLYMEPPQVNRSNVCADIALEGAIQILYEDTEGMLQCTSERWQKIINESVDTNADYQVCLQCMEIPTPEKLSDIVLQLHEKTMSMRPLQMVNGAQIGDLIPLDPVRPSVILRRAEGNSLWEIAKSLGSTVEEIQKMNGIQEEPDDEQLLLIPIN